MKQKPLGTRRLFGKFLLLLMPVFAAATAVGLLFISQFFMRDEQNQLNARIGNLVARVASIVANESSSSAHTPLETYLGVLMADRAVMCAELFNDGGKMIAAAPHRIGCKGQDDFEFMSLRLPGKNSGKLHVRYSNVELAAIRADKRLFTQLALVIGLLMAAMASWLGFRVIVGRPVGSLLAAIRKSEEGGIAATVENPPKDELGTVIGAFNTMQVRLQNEAARNLAALRHLDHLYNETPALMFSICPAGHISNVSGHWLEQTGYQRKDVVGAPLGNFLRSYEGDSEIDLRLITSGGIRDVPLWLTCNNGATMDVLLSAIPSQSRDDPGCDYLCVMSDVSSLNAARKKLQTQAITDHLTGLPNRQALFEYLARIGKMPRQEFHNSAVLFIDLDNFKWVNDTHGHDAGDMLLRAASTRLQHCIGGLDFLARLGGDEFAVVLRDLRDKHDAQTVAGRIVAQMSLPFEIGPVSVFVGCSVGIADASADVHSAEELLRLADLAMYKSKQDGRNRVTPYSADLSSKVTERDNVVAHIRMALKENHFRLFLQPIIALDTMKPAGAEALLRVVNPRGGFISPAEIIRTAEETGLMGQIGEWVVEEGCAIGNRWVAAENPLYFSLNLSPRQLDQKFMSDLVARLHRNPFAARKLVFEITESALLQNAERISQFFAGVRASGARIALDDFGTGYSSLNYISRFPVDFVKLDRSFVRHLGDADNATAHRNLALIRATATLCRELEIAVVAEGVETIAELERLRSIGVDYGQGYLFSPALPEEEFTEWARNFGHNPGHPAALARAS